MDGVSISPEIFLNWNCRRRYDTELAAYSIQRPNQLPDSLEYSLSSANGAEYLLLMTLAVVFIDSDAKRKNSLVTIRLRDEENGNWTAKIPKNELPFFAGTCCPSKL